MPKMSHHQIDSFGFLDFDFEIVGFGFVEIELVGIEDAKLVQKCRCEGQMIGGCVEMELEEMKFGQTVVGLGYLGT